MWYANATCDDVFDGTGQRRHECRMGFRWAMILGAAWSLAQATGMTMAGAASAAPPVRAGGAGAEGADGKPAGIIVFESNRTGNWELYAINLDGSNERALTDNGADNFRPTLSPDGSRIAWTKSEGSRGGVYSMRLDGSDERIEADGGDNPAYLPDGQIFFTRRLDGGDIAMFTMAAPGAEPEPRGTASLLGLKAKDPVDISTGADVQLFVYRAADPRGTSLLSALGAGEQHIHKGCMPRFQPDGVNFIWVRVPGEFGIGRVVGGLQLATLYKIPKDAGEYTHAYFPALSANYTHLVFASCPENQHNHDTANYQIFVQGIEDGKFVGAPRRLTHNDATDRRPVIWTPAAGEYLARLASAKTIEDRAPERLDASVPGFGGIVNATGAKGGFDLRMDFGQEGEQLARGFEVQAGEVRIVPEGLRVSSGAVLESAQTLENAMRAIRTTGEFTIIADVWVPDREQHRQGVVLMLKGQESRGNLALLQKGARCRVALKDQDGDLDFNNPQLDGKLPSGGFNHIVVTYGDGSLHLYINGRSVDSTKIFEKPSKWVEDARLVFGGKTGFWSGPWDGSVRYVQIISQKLSKEGVKDRYGLAKRERNSSEHAGRNR